MSAFANQPANKNFLSPLGFKFNIKKTPNMVFFTQAVNLPGIISQHPTVPTPFKGLPRAGDHLQFDGSINVSFKVAEDLSDYLEIFNWLVGIGFPNDFDQYKNLAPTTVNGGRNLNAGITAKPGSGEGVYSDATLMILTSDMNPNIQVNITDLFPVALSGLNFDARLPDVVHMEATASFAFNNYTFEAL